MSIAAMSRRANWARPPALRRTSASGVFVSTKILLNGDRKIGGELGYEILPPYSKFRNFSQMTRASMHVMIIIFGDATPRVWRSEIKGWVGCVW